MIDWQPQEHGRIFPSIEDVSDRYQAAEAVKMTCAQRKSGIAWGYMNLSAGVNSLD